jgi:hypothetical protein
MGWIENRHRTKSLLMLDFTESRLTTIELLLNGIASAPADLAFWTL